MRRQAPRPGYGAANAVRSLLAALAFYAIFATVIGAIALAFGWSP